MPLPAVSASSPGYDTYEGIDTVVLYDELAYQDVVPVQWQELTQALEPFTLQGMEESNALLLQTCVAVEEHPARDKSDEPGPLAGEVARLDFKLNLILQLLGRLVLKDAMPAPTSIQFNAHGASWQSPDAPPAPGTHGLLRVQLRSSLPQPLELPAQVIDVADVEVRVRFEPLSPVLSELIQKLAFLRHRRHVAGVRQARAP